MVNKFWATVGLLLLACCSQLSSSRYIQDANQHESNEPTNSIHLEEVESKIADDFNKRVKRFADLQPAGQGNGHVQGDSESKNLLMQSRDHRRLKADRDEFSRMLRADNDDSNSSNNNNNNNDGSMSQEEERRRENERSREQRGRRDRRRNGQRRRRSRRRRQQSRRRRGRRSRRGRRIRQSSSSTATPFTNYDPNMYQGFRIMGQPMSEPANLNPNLPSWASNYNSNLNLNSNSNPQSQWIV